MARLENWTLVNRLNGYGKPCQILFGEVYEHPFANPDTGELCNGHEVMTSPIVSLDLDNNIAVTSSGTVYQLGSKHSNKK